MNHKMSLEELENGEEWSEFRLAKTKYENQSQFCGVS